MDVDYRFMFSIFHFNVNNSPAYIPGIFDRFPRANMSLFPALINN